MKKKFKEPTIKIVNFNMKDKIMDTTMKPSGPAPNKDYDFDSYELIYSNDANK